MSDDPQHFDMFEDKHLNEILANGMLAGILSLANQYAGPSAQTRFEVVFDDDNDATNAHHIWFPALKSRYKLTVEMDPEETG